MVILFPNDPVLKYIAIALYDGGVIAWLTTYIGRAKGTPQRGIALLMTALDFLGVAAMVIAGIYLSGQTLADIPPWVGSTVVNVTIIAAVVNAGAIYYYHAHDPATIEEIQAQELEDDLNEEALEQARMQVQRNAQALGAIIANRVTARMKYRMRLPMSEIEAAEWRGEIVDAPSYDMASLTTPPVQTETFWSAVKSFFGGKPSRQPSDTQPSRSSTDSQQPEPGAPDNWGPLWKNSTNIAPTLIGYSWECAGCQGTNGSALRECQWCRQPRTNGSVIVAIADMPPKETTEELLAEMDEQKPKVE